MEQYLISTKDWKAAFNHQHFKTLHLINKGKLDTALSGDTL